MSLTTDEEALLAAIDAAPLDDAPRLVYADWLQERGDEVRAEYLRTLVRLLHPPEDAALVARIVVLAGEIDHAWRLRVGGRFEVLMDGSAAVLLIGTIFQAVFNLMAGSSGPWWEKGQPVRLTSGLTREDAERFVHEYEPGLKAIHVTGGEPLRLVVQPMGEASSTSLFA